MSFSLIVTTYLPRFDFASRRREKDIYACKGKSSAVARQPHRGVGQARALATISDVLKYVWRVIAAVCCYLRGLSNNVVLSQTIEATTGDTISL